MSLSAELLHEAMNKYCCVLCPPVDGGMSPYKGDPGWGGGKTEKKRKM